MENLIINTSKTEKGYSASCDLLAGWVVAYTGDFNGFKNYVKESIAFYLDCAKEDEEFYPPILESEYNLKFQFNE